MGADSYDSYNYKGFTINVEQDPDPWNPRDDDNLTVMACFHKRYVLGDKGHGLDIDDYSGWDEMLAAITKKHKPAVIAQLFLYDHSGLSIKIGSFNGLLPQGHAEFDSGPVGFIWITKEAARKEYGWKKLTKSRIAQLQKYIEGDVQTYDDYLSGSVYGYIIVDSDGNPIDDGGRWGFYGDESVQENGYAIQEAKGIIDQEIRSRIRAALPENNPAQMTLGLEGIS